MDLGLADRRALVGGGASGIGNGIATALATLVAIFFLGWLTVWVASLWG